MVALMDQWSKSRANCT